MTLSAPPQIYCDNVTMTEPVNSCKTCRHRQTFSCSCTKPKCRANLPYFPHQGSICPQWKDRRVGT